MVIRQGPRRLGFRSSPIVFRIQGATAMEFGSIDGLLGYGTCNRSGEALLQA